MTGVKIAVITLFSTTGVLGTTATPDYIQYGALGLCGLMVMYLMNHISHLGKVIEKRDDEYVELIKRDIVSRDRLSNALEKRKCLADDSMIREG